jgi:hypothetical protein
MRCHASRSEVRYRLASLMVARYTRGRGRECRPRLRGGSARTIAIVTYRPLSSVVQRFASLARHHGRAVTGASRSSANSPPPQAGRNCHTEASSPPTSTSHFKRQVTERLPANFLPSNSGRPHALCSLVYTSTCTRNVIIFAARQAAVVTLSDRFRRRLSRSVVSVTIPAAAPPADEPSAQASTVFRAV